MHRRGFTPVQLLVVIAITALLAALLLPALGNGKSQARRVQCASQLQEWGKALQMHANDNTDATPGTGCKTVDTNKSPGGLVQRARAGIELAGIRQLHRQRGNQC